MRLVWDDEDYVEAWDEIIATGTHRPVVELAERAGVVTNTAAQRLHRLRLKGLITTDGNTVRGAGSCPHCGAPRSAQRPQRAAARQGHAP